MEIAVSYEELKSENTALRSEVSVLRAENAEINAKLNWLIEQLSSNNRKLYGSSSEKSAYDQIGLFSEGVPVLPASGPEESADAAPPRQRPKKQGEMGSRLPAGLPIVKIECVLPDEERVCREHNVPMRPIVD